MKRLAVVAVGVLLASVCAACRFNTARAVTEEAPDPFVQMAAVEEKRRQVLDEIQSLGPSHLWAGVYHGNIGVPFSLVIAPQAGCVTTIFGCFGLRDSKWSPVRPIEPDEVHAERALEAFGERFVLGTEGSSATLRGGDGVVYARDPHASLEIERLR